MTDDWLLKALAEVDRTVLAARDALTAAEEIVEPIRAGRRAGVPLPNLAADLVRTGSGPRRALAAAFREYELLRGIEFPWRAMKYGMSVKYAIEIVRPG